MKNLNRLFFLFNPDDGGGAGGGGGKPDDPDDGGKPEDIADFSEWLKGQSESVRKAFETHTQGLKSALTDERKRAREAQKALDAQEKEKAAANEKSLQEQQKFAELAAERAKQLAKLQPELEASKREAEDAKTAAEQSEAVLKEMLDAQLKALNVDEATAELLSGKTTIEQLRWLAKHGEKLGAKKGIPRSPDDTGAGKKLTPEEAVKTLPRTW